MALIRLKVLFLIIFLLLSCFPRLAECNDQPFAVVELFTSEGCSSCPVADKFLQSLTYEARRANSRIFTLSFHVDYWNYLGWVDPFSNVQFSNRQKQYVQALRLNSAYTPQMIINGVYQFGGYKKDTAQKYITQALSTPTKTDLNISIKTMNDDKIIINYETSFSTPDYNLNIALVERNIISRVLRGENAGKTITHDNIVREFKTISLDKKIGEAIIPISKLSNKTASSIIAYLQHKNTMQIIAATMRDL